MANTIWKTGLLSLALSTAAVLAGCGGNPEDKESNPIDRTRMFTKTVKGEYGSSTGETLQFGDRKRVLISSAHSYPVSVVSSPGQLSISLKDESGYERSQYLSLGLSEPPEGALSGSLTCQFDHSGTIESVKWLPRPKKQDKISYSLKRFRDKAQDINYVIYLNTLSTVNVDFEMGTFGHSELDDLLKNNADFLRFIEEFCESSERPRYNDTDKEGGTTHIPLAAFSKTQLQIVQYKQDSYSRSLMKFGVSSKLSEGSTQVEFTRTQEK